MNILLFLDYSSYSERVLAGVKKFMTAVNAEHIQVIHIIDEQQFNSSTGFEVQLSDTVHAESMELRKMCIDVLGNGVQFMEEYGIPRLKAAEILHATACDILVAGSNSRHGMGSRPLGSFAEHLVRISKLPVVIIPLN